MNPTTNPSNPATLTTQASNRAEPSRLRVAQKTNEYQRSRFDNAMSRARTTSVGEKPELSGEEAAALVLLAQNQMPLQNVSSNFLFDDKPSGGLVELTDVSNNGALVAPVAVLQTPEIQAPASVFSPAQAQSSHLYAHMALPLNVGEELSKFEVIDGNASLVSHISLATLPEGGLSVDIGTSVQHADLMDRHLPKLQRRLAAKVATHMRIVESDAAQE
jgi:hypothetical protein